MLKKIRRSFAIIFILASMLVGFWVFAENTNSIELTLFGFVLEQQPLGLVIVATFTVGVILGLFCNVLATSWMIFKMKQLQKRLQHFESKS